jgi:hypothetical protein
MNRRSLRSLAIGFILGAGVSATLLAADNRRAPPPKFDATVVKDTFFTDARKHLGPGGPPVPGQPAGAPGAPAAPGMPAGAAGGGEMHLDGNAWSAIISSDTLESEVKAQPAQIDAAMKSTNQQKAARLVMTYLAAVYGVIYRYDKDVRWKDDSQPLRDNFARAGNNLKAWTDSQKKQVAKLKTDLTDLIGGNKPSLTAGLDGEAPWKEIADRPPLMHRLEQGQSEKINGWCKDADSVKRNAAGIVQEAEVFAMIARIIQDKSYEFGDDETYLGFAKNLEKHAVALVAATKAGDGAAASSAAAQMNKDCDDCHGGYR